jgi:hypothetical protein
MEQPKDQLLSLSGRVQHKAPTGIRPHPEKVAATLALALRASGDLAWEGDTLPGRRGSLA